MTTIGYGNLIDSSGVTLSATNAISTLPAANLQQTHLVNVFRVNGTDTMISLDFGQQVTLRQIAFMATNYATGSISLTADNSAQSGTGVLSGFTSFDVDTTYGQIFGDLGSDTTARYWELTVSASALSDGASNLEFGRLFMGPTIDFNRNISYPLEIYVQDQSQVRRTLGGQQFVWELPQYRVVNFIYGIGLSNSQGFDTLLRTLDRVAGKRQEVLLIVDANDNQLGIKQMVWGFLSSLGPASVAGYNQLEKEYTLEETN